MSEDGGDRLRAIIAALVLTGVGVAGYLTYVHYAGIDPVCAGAGGGCHTVQASEYADLAGVPVALIGLIGYLALAAALLMPGEAGRATTMGLALAGAGFSLYLSYVELFVIDAICQWCVASAVLMVLLAILSTMRMLRGAENYI
ncbi:MAG: vitamin K epoxide reductase family protein [Solirubrobacterales bacterium]|nr:vitamin K epoxide reductase family protein [Solirubrobacterales bacterium]